MHALSICYIMSKKLVNIGTNVGATTLILAYELNYRHILIHLYENLLRYISYIIML